MNVTDKKLDLLIRCLGMLGSDQDGEVMAAGRKAHMMVQAMGLDWQTLLTPPEETPTVSVNVGGKPAGGTTSPPPPPPPPPPGSNSWARNGRGFRSGQPHLALHLAPDQHKAVAQQMLSQFPQFVRTTAKPGKSSDHDFLTGITVSQHQYLTMRQWAWFDEIAQRCGIVLPRPTP